MAGRAEAVYRDSEGAEVFLMFDSHGIRKASFWLALISMQAWLFFSLPVGIKPAGTKEEVFIGCLFYLRSAYWT